MSAQFQQELSAKFEQNYNTIIEQLKMENTNIQYDKNHLEAIIRQMIYEYDTDKTGKVDYALESSGGAVVSTRCSETYKSYTRLEKFWDIPIYYFHYSPRVVIQVSALGSSDSKPIIFSFSEKFQIPVSWGMLVLQRIPWLHCCRAVSFH